MSDPEYNAMPAMIVRKVLRRDKFPHDSCQGRPRRHYLYPHTHLHYLTMPVLGNVIMFWCGAVNGLRLGVGEAV